MVENQKDYTQFYKIDTKCIIMNVKCIRFISEE